jgi:ferritin-like metal-binding protein YciE
VAQMTKRDSTVTHYLNDAYALERRLELTLEAHADATTRPEYEKRLKRHLAETKSHAAKLERRIRRLGGTPETVSLPAPEGVLDKLGSAQEVVQRATAAVQSSLQSVRRTGEQELMLKQARAEFAAEAEEIAAYRAIDGLATAVGDPETARLAREILREEERMAAYLGDLIPQLATDLVHDAVPVSEIEGPAAHRTSADGAGARRARRARRTRAASKARLARRRAGDGRSARAVRRAATARRARPARRRARGPARRRSRSATD